MFGEVSMLWWAAAAAIPILIHLFTRQRFRRVPWAAMDFLRRAFQKTRRRLRLENLLLLLLRVLALILLALALAEPKIKSSILDAGKDTRREVVLIVDNSFSMALRESSGDTPFRRAHDQALRLVRGLERERGDTATLITAGRSASLLLRRATDLDRVAAEVDRLEVSDSATDLLGALRTAVAVVDEKMPKGVEVYLFTDLQKSAFVQDTESGVKPAQRNAPGSLPAQPSQLLASQVTELKTRGAHVTIVAGFGQEADNLAVTNLELGSKVASVGQPLRFVATVKNFGRRPASGVVNLFVDGAETGVDSQPIDLVQPGSTQVVDFRYTFREPGPHQVEARFTTDALEVDNRRALAVTVQDHVRAIVVDGSPSTEADEEASFFLRTALELGGSPTRPSLFEVKPVTEVAFDRESLTEVDLVVLVNVANVSERRVRELEDFVTRGGGLAIFVGPRTQAAAINDQLYRDGAGLLPAKLGTVTGEVGSRTVAFELKPVVTDRPPLSYFNDERVRAMLVGAPFYRYYAATVKADDPSVRVLAQFESPTAALTSPSPAVIEKTFGAGRVILVTSSADREWNELAVLPTYVPFVKEIAYHLVRRSSAIENLTVGDSYRREIDRFVRDVTVQRGGTQVKVVKPLALQGRTGYEIRVDDLTKSGVYRLDYAEDNEPGRKPMPSNFVAVNVDPRESDLTRLTSEAVAQMFPSDALRLVDAVEAENAGEMQGNDRAWWWVVWVVLGLLTAETILSQWFGRPGRGGDS